MVTPDEISRLDLPPGTPVLDLICTAYTGDGPIQILFSVVAADTHLLHYVHPTDPLRPSSSDK